MAKIVVQIGLATRNGGLVPLASSRDPRLARAVADHIIAELKAGNYADPSIAVLAREEGAHLSRIMEKVGRDG